MKAFGQSLLAVAPYLLGASGAIFFSSTSIAQSRTPAIQTMVSREASEGYTQADINMQAVSKLEAQTLDQFKASLGRELSRNGKTFNPNRMTAESVIAEIGQRRLVVTKIKVDGKEAVDQIFGLVGNEAIRVACVSSAFGGGIVTSPECSSRVKAVFGVDFRKPGR